MDRLSCKLLLILGLACFGCQTGPKMSGLTEMFRKPEKVEPEKKEPKVEVAAKTEENKPVPPEKPAEPKPAEPKPEDPKAKAVAGVQHNPETLKLIEEELKYATTEEDKQQILGWKQLDPIFIRELVKIRRMNRQFVAAVQASGDPEVLAQMGHTQSPGMQTDPATTAPEVSQIAAHVPPEGNVNTGLGSSPWTKENPSGENPVQQAVSSSNPGQHTVLSPIQATSGQQNASTVPGQLLPNQPSNPLQPQQQMTGHSQLPGLNPQAPARLPQSPTVPGSPGSFQPGEFQDQFPPVFDNQPNPALQTPGALPQNPPQGMFPQAQQPGAFPQTSGNLPNHVPGVGLNQENQQQMPQEFPGQPAVPGQSRPMQTAVVPASVNPGNFPSSSPGVIQARWKEDLQKMIALAEVEVNNLPLGSTPQEQQRYVEEQVHLRLLYLLAGQPERTIQPIPGLDAAQQEFWQQVFWGMSNYFDDENIPDQADRMGQTVSQLRNAIQHLQSLARLELRNVNFCHKITSFGSYEKFPTDEFSRGQPVLVYAEVGNFTSRPSADGSHFETSLKSTIEIYRAGELGGLVERVDFPTTRDLSHNHRQDYFHSYEFTIPQQISLGPHVLKLTVEDQLGKKIATYTLNFTVK